MKNKFVKLGFFVTMKICFYIMCIVYLFFTLMNYVIVEPLKIIYNESEKYLQLLGEMTGEI